MAGQLLGCRLSRSRQPRSHDGAAHALLQEQLSRASADQEALGSARRVPSRPLYPSLRAQMTNQPSTAFVAAPRISAMRSNVSSGVTTGGASTNQELEREYARSLCHCSQSTRADTTRSFLSTRRVGHRRRHPPLRARRHAEVRLVRARKARSSFSFSSARLTPSARPRLCGRAEPAFARA